MIADLILIFIVLAVAIVSVFIFITITKKDKKVIQNGTFYNSNDNYVGAKIISFIFPIIGLIIYAVNIGKNDDLAKDCSKWAIISIVIIVFVFIFTFLFSMI